MPLHQLHILLSYSLSIPLTRDNLLWLSVLKSGVEIYSVHRTSMGRPMQCWALGRPCVAVQVAPGVRTSPVEIIQFDCFTDALLHR